MSYEVPNKGISSDIPDSLWQKMSRLQDLDKKGLIKVGENGHPVWTEDGSPVVYVDGE